MGLRTRHYLISFSVLSLAILFFYVLIYDYLDLPHLSSGFIEARLSRRKSRQSHQITCDNYPNDCRLNSPFIFDSIYSLLKQWPSTYSPNGHSVVVATIPAHIPLYHAKVYAGPPKTPTFYAFDA